MRCMVCGKTNPEDFTLHSKTFLCDECFSIIRHHYSELKKELEDAYRETHFGSLWECEVLEGLEEFIEIRSEEQRKERRHGNISRHKNSK